MSVHFPDRGASQQPWMAISQPVESCIRVTSSARWRCSWICKLRGNGGVLALMKASQDRCPPWYLGGLIRKPLREIGVILLHDVEHCLLGAVAMVQGK
jgi:hypothetical protein